MINKHKAILITITLHKSITENKPFEVCVGEVELLLKGFDNIVEKQHSSLDENGESVNQR